MEKLIIIRYSEIFLKGDNKSFFENLLIHNIKNSLKNIDCKVIRQRGRITIEKYTENDEIIIEKLQKVFGIHTISSALKVNNDIELIFQAAQTFMKKSGTFKVNTTRADKTFFLTSIQVSKEIGGRLLETSSELKVDVHNPDFVINIDIRESGSTYVFSDFYEGAHGMPCGCAGKGALMLSGGIDSPVAGYMIAKRGMKLIGIHFYSYPFTSELAKQKVITLCEKLSTFNGRMELFVVPFTEIQQEIHTHCAEDYMITLMRRFMMRITEKIAKKENAMAIINGESLGQVASQTIESINVTNSVVNLPVLRPLIGLDKLDIIKVAEKIDTYKTSILPYEDCCTVFLPKRPVIKPKISFADKEESKLDIEKLEEKAISETEIIIIG